MMTDTALQMSLKFSRSIALTINIMVIHRPIVGKLFRIPFSLTDQFYLFTLLCFSNLILP